MILVYLGWPKPSPWLFKSRKTFPAIAESERARTMEEQLEGGNGAGFEDGGRATSQGTQPASENWKT